MILSPIVFTVMLRATKYRIYPTSKQKQHLAQSFGCCRFAWNYALNLTNETYKATGKGQFCTMLKYKAELEGKVYLEVDRFFPSSKTCNVCLNQVRSLTLDVRTWQCEKCQTKHDRDINAAKNIRDEGLRILSSVTGKESRSPRCKSRQ
jgi:transposase